jgi:valyl-tRNA synthetase
MALASTYTPKKYEDQIYASWQQAKVGSPEEQVLHQKNTTAAYANLMPPPNLTGSLHAGHALGHYVMDTLTRIHRQKKEKSLWFPGVDHAGIQLEGVIDKAIKAGEFDEVLSKYSLPEQKSDWPKYLKTHKRELWLELAWSRVTQWRDHQAKQSAILGDTPDYERNLFTLDEPSKEMVFTAFKRYYEDGLLYKKSYLINWSVGLQTALSDVPEDIGHEKRKDPFVTFEYRHDGEGLVVNDFLNQLNEELLGKITQHFEQNPILVSTVRPETIFADKAVLMHPEILKKWLAKGDLTQNEQEILEKNLINENLTLSCKIEGMVQGIPLIFGEEVDPDFGTGALKITPAHDMADYEIFHKYLGGEFEQAVGRDGRLTEICGGFAGLTVEEGRKKVIDTLIETGYVPHKKDAEGNDTEEYEIDWNYEHNVTICERSKTVVEPLISEEFFLSYTHKDAHGKSLQEYGLEGVGETSYYPKEYQDMAQNYIENIKDWCISRDLVWGHKIPIWYNLDRNPEKKFYSHKECVANPELYRDFYIDHLMPEKYGNWVQEEKILDTWFSSCLWPLSTLGYPDGADYKEYYPTQDMVTAREIFYAWIVRMTVLGKYFTGKIPFENVIITPTVLDEQGKKMSKSLKNGLDPVAAISNYSSDSLRLAMLSGMIPNRNMRLGGSIADKLMEKYRNFGNKVWNIARFFEMQRGEGLAETTRLSSASVWILEKYRMLLSQLHSDTETFELAHSVDALYRFLWDDFADWYVEYLKTDTTQISFAIDLFEQFIVTLNPYMPFETEVIWREFFSKEMLLAFEPLNLDFVESNLGRPENGEKKDFELVVAFIQEMRSSRGLFAIDPAIFLDFYTKSKVLILHKEYVKLAGRIELESEEIKEYSIGDYGSLDILTYIKDREGEKARTQKVIASLEIQLSAIHAQLNNVAFIEHATAEAIIEKKEQQKLRTQELEDQKKKLSIL